MLPRYASGMNMYLQGSASLLLTSAYMVNGQCTCTLEHDIYVRFRLDALTSFIIWKHGYRNEGARLFSFVLLITFVALSFTGALYSPYYGMLNLKRELPHFLVGPTEVRKPPSFDTLHTAVVRTLIFFF